MPIKEIIGGDTIKLKFVSSGDTFSPIFANILAGSESLVNSASMASSGNGHYYYNYTTVTTPGYYAAEYVGYINSLSYIRREWFKIMPREVR